MRWNDLKTVIVEAGEKVVITITFESGLRINVNNVPKTVTTMPNFEETVQAAAQKAKPNETYSSWSITGSDIVRPPKDEVRQQIAQLIRSKRYAEALAAVESDGRNVLTSGEMDALRSLAVPSGSFVPNEAEEEAMKNVSDLRRLIMTTWDNSVRRGLTHDDKENPEPRDVDPEFADGVSFEYSRDGRTYTINDIKEEFNITAKINTKNPSKDEYGVNYSEGWPNTMNDWNDLKEMVIDAVDAGEHITTVGPAQDDSDDTINIAPESFYYKRAIVYNTGDN